MSTYSSCLCCSSVIRPVKGTLSHPESYQMPKVVTVSEFILNGNKPKGSHKYNKNINFNWINFLLVFLI
jgi:hypothetical protein